MTELEFPTGRPGGPPILKPRMCRSCGCTDYRACLDPVRGLPCHWVEDDFCSVCADELESV